MMRVTEVIRRIGGQQRLIKLLGYPVNVYTIQLWRRAGYIPAEYREKIADTIGIDPELLEPDTEGDAPKMEYKALARAYSALLGSCKLEPAKAAKLHNVGPGLVEEWRNGYAEVPFSAFEQVYMYLKGSSRRVGDLSIERALMATGLTQRELCQKIGVSGAMGSYWRRKGKVPEKHAERIRELITQLRRERVRKDEELDACLNGD